MAEFEALYDPGFEPDPKWLRSFLLFFDKIRSIVPKDVDFKLSKEILELLDLIPDAFETISPTEEDISVEELNLNTMRAAFKIIGEEEERVERKRVKIQIDGGKISIPGYARLHGKKISYEVSSLLREFGLIRTELTDLAADIVKEEGFYVVNENASSLILSNVADRIGSRNGWNTITDREMDFAVNVLNSFQYKSVEDPESMLISSVISCEIPQEIQHLNPREYKEIYDSYSDIREPFHHVIRERSSLHQLGKIESRDVLEDRVREITDEFSLEVEKIRKSNFGRRIARWIPISVGTIANIVIGIFSGNMLLSIAGSVTSSMQVIQEITRKDPQTDKEKIQRMLGEMRKDILKKAKIKEILRHT